MLEEGARLMGYIYYSIFEDIYMSSL
jgi:hypothetical protein